MSTRQKISLQHTFKRVFTQHLNHSSGTRKFAPIRIFWKEVFHPEFFGNFVDIIQFVRRIFIWTKNSEVFGIIFHDVPKEFPQGSGVFGLLSPWSFDLIGVVPEVWHLKCLLYSSTIRMRAHTHT